MPQFSTDEPHTLAFKEKLKRFIAKALHYVVDDCGGTHEHDETTSRPTNRLTDQPTERLTSMNDMTTVATVRHFGKTNAPSVVNKHREVSRQAGSCALV